MWLVGFNKKVGVIVPLLFYFVMAEAQIPTDEWTSEMHEKYAILQDGINSDNTHDALEALKWLKTNHPKAHENIYILGVKLLRKEINASDKNIKDSLFQELMNLYQLRQSYFDTNEIVAIRAALDAYSLGRGIESIEVDSVQLHWFNRLYDQYPEKMESSHFVAYMQIVIHGYQQKFIQKDRLFQYYISITEGLIDLEKKDASEKLTEHQMLVDQLLVKNVSISCEEIENQFSKGLKGDNQAYFAKLMVKLSLNFECTDSEAFLEALQLMYKENPTSKIASYLAKKLEIGGQKDEAEKYAVSAYELADTDENKAKAAFELAEFYARRENKIASRKYIKVCLSHDPQNREAYTLWGDLYFQSFHECKKEVSKVEDRLIYLAAYEKYKLANNKSKMAASEQQFPLGEDIHFENYTKDEEVMCECWINEKVVLMKRPND